MLTLKNDSKILHSARLTARLALRPSLAWKAIVVLSLLPALWYAGMYPPWYLCLTIVAFAGATCCDESRALARSRLDLLDAYKDKVAFGYSLTAMTWAVALSLAQSNMIAESWSVAQHLVPNHSAGGKATIAVIWGVFAFSWGWTMRQERRGRKAFGHAAARA